MSKKDNLMDEVRRLIKSMGTEGEPNPPHPRTLEERLQRLSEVDPAAADRFRAELKRAHQAELDQKGEEE